MDYQFFEKLLEGKTLPLMGENDDGEVVIVDKGKDDEGAFYETQTAQNNDWVRINRYYITGVMTETYDR